MNAPKHEDPAAPVKVGWGTAATLTVVAIAVLALVAWGGRAPTDLDRRSRVLVLGRVHASTVSLGSP